MDKVCTPIRQSSRVGPLADDNTRRCTLAAGNDAAVKAAASNEPEAAIACGSSMRWGVVGAGLLERFQWV